MKLLPCLLLLCINSLTLAQDTLQRNAPYNLKEVIVTYQADKLTPVTFQNISSLELKAKSVGQEPSFLLAETPSITAYSDAGNTQGYSYIRMRGIDQTRINVSLDGVSLNEPEDQGTYFSNFADIFNSVSKVQIQRGVGTSKNGVASYGGSIQLFSPNLYDTAKTRVGFAYGSFNSMRAFGEFNSGIKNKKAFYVRASQVYSDGYKYHASNNSQSVFASGGLFFEKSIWKLNLLLGHQQNQLAWLGVSDSLISIDRKTNANKNERDNFTQCVTQIQNNWRPTPSTTVQSSLYYTFATGNYDFNLNGFLGLPTTDELYNYALRSNVIGFFSTYKYSASNLNWTTGIHGYTYNRQHTGSEKTLGQLYTNTGYKKEMSIFTKADYKRKWLTAFADIQYRYSFFDYKGSVDFDQMQWHFINPKVGLTADIAPNSIVYYSVGRTSREPTRNDIFGGNDDLLADSTGTALLSITNAEHVIDHELGLRHQWAKSNLDFNLYYMDFDHEIVLDGNFGPNGLALTNNVTKSYRTGVEVSLSYSVSKRFSLANNSSFNYSRIKEQQEIFSPILTPPIIINQEAVYRYKNVLLAISARYQGKSFIDFANTSLINSYLLLNSRIEYKIKELQFCVFVNNITNAKYYNNGSIHLDGSKRYFVQAPTTTTVSVNYSF